MPVELHILKDRLYVLNLLYENAIMNRAPTEEKQKLQQQITEVHRQITETNKLVKRDQRANQKGEETRFKKHRF